MEAFEKVLIKWVNCLKFAEPIRNLDDLKNGIFLHNLQKIISRKNLPCVGTDTLTFLFKLLELHYPKFVIDNKSNIHLNDLPHETLLCVVSLVLHYICIYDRRPVFASSLCTELDTPSQLAIKNFLEKIAECAEIDNATLIRVINSSIENENAEEVQKVSPLQLLLKTPVSKANRLIKRDQEITSLITEIELLQEEKERLQADVKAERGKNKTLGKQLNNKNEEISQLRSEILALEGRTPPNYQDADLRESQKILRAKVETLEEIIKQNYKDYEELTDKREEDRAQLKNVEAQCNMWLTKFIESNNQLHVLSEICEGQEVKLKNFERHCNELEALLEEMKSKTVHESLMEESFKSTEVPNYQSPSSKSFSCSEDLARSVVDLQLKDQQHENTLLKSALKNAENVNEELHELNEILTTEKNELCNKLLMKEFHLQKKSQDLKKVLVVYSEMCRKHKCLNLDEEAKEVCKDEENKPVEIEKLCSEVSNITNNFETALLENNTIINKLKSEICKLKQECQQITNHNQFLTVKCSDLQKSLSFAAKQKEELEENCQKSKSDLISAIKNIVEKENKLQQATETNNVLNLQCSNLMRRLSAVMKQKEELKEDFQKSENSLEIAINDKQVALVNYVKSIAIVNLFFHNYRNLLVFVYLLNVANNAFNTKIRALEDQNNRLLECLSLATEEKTRIEDRCKQIEDDFFHVKMAYENFKRLSEERASSREQKTMAISHSLECSLKQLETEKETLIETIESCKKEVDKLSEENKALRFSLDEVKTEYQTMKDKQLAIIDTQTEALQEAECTLSRYIQGKADVSGLLEKMKNDKVIIQKEFITNLKTVRDANLKVGILTRENLAMSYSLESTLKQLDTCTLEKEALTETVESFQREIDKLSDENKTLRLNLSEARKLSEENELLRSSLEEARTEHQIMKEEQLAVIDAQAAALHEAECNVLHSPEPEELKNSLKKTQEAYSKVVSMNVTLDVENSNMRKKIKCLSRQLEEHAQIKEAYEKLLEENSKLQTERDTVKYKRLRDREEFMKMIKKERENIEAMANKKIKEIRHDYEVKADMMREQMLKLYNDEVKKEIRKVNQEGGKSNIYQKQTEELRKQLSEAKYKIRMLELDRELSDQRTSRNIMNSRESLISLPERSSQSFYLNQPESVSKPLTGQLTRKIKSISTMRSNDNSRRASTLPRSQFAEIKESDRIARQSSVGAHANIGNLEMEDEDDDFNNKYLMDLKAGRCVVKEGSRRSDASRVSELAWRNSLMPPHLKSSYPVEAQFYSPSKFKDDDLKAGNIDLDNSQSKLLPSEKPRPKKDFGTTSYRKPGPPTPSKNARLSQQSNEIQPLREQNERTPKRLTPSRIRMMFTGKSSSTQVKDNTENQTDTPKTNKRLSLFRKQK